MGFGILFIGYFFTMNIKLRGYDVPPDFIGYMIMIYACNKLSDYSSFFRKTSKILIVMALLSAAYSGTQLYTNVFGELPELIPNILIISKLMLSIVMHYFLLNAIIEISEDVGRKKIAGKCRRNLYITWFLLILQTVSSLPVFQFEGQAYYLISIFIANFAVLLNSIQIFSCYMWICYEGDEEMDAENTIDPLAKMINKTRKEAAEYNKQKQLERAEKRKSRRKK